VPAGQLATGEIVAALRVLRVLTADEVASVLRVDAKVIVAAISSGELPGNRVGTHWRVDQGALTRWLQGGYGTAAGSSGSAPPAE
jgi:excisionase family DNA binding protein